MAKKPMTCAFSKKLCRECSFYIGRHYYLCFFEGYRGYLGREADVDLVKPSPYSKDLKDRTHQS